MNYEDCKTVDVLVLSSIFFGGHQLTDQRVARALRAEGHVVTYVDPGLRPFSRSKFRAQGRSAELGSTRRDGIEVFTPLALPMGGRPVIGGVNAVLLALQLMLAFYRRLGPDSRVLVFSAHPLVLSLLRRWQNVVVVKDDYVAGADLIDANRRTVERRRRRTLNHADRVATVSAKLHATLLQQGVRATIIGPGVDLPTRSRSEDEELRDIPRPRALFVGMISDRVDLDLLAAVVDAGWHLVVVGGYQATFTQRAVLDRLLATDRITLLGWQEPAKVQSIAQWCDAGLLLYTMSPFNRSSSPLKFLEYLAAGLPVVGTRLPSLVNREAPDVAFVDTPADVPAALTASLAVGRDTDRDRRRAYAAAHSWSSRAREYAALLELDGRPSP